MAVVRAPETGSNVTVVASNGSGREAAKLPKMPAPADDTVATLADFAPVPGLDEVDREFERGRIRACRAKGFTG